MRRVALLLGALTAVPAAVQAQLCLGQAPWSSGAIKVGGELEFGDGYWAPEGTIAIGKDGGFFFGAGAGVANYDGPGSQVFLHGTVGKEIGTKIADKGALCPVAHVFYGLPDHDFSYFTATGGLAIGYPISGGSENLNLVLHGQARAGLDHESLAGASHNSFLAVVDAGVGLIFNNRISLVPVIRIYFGDEHTDVAFAARANIGLGKK